MPIQVRVASSTRWVSRLRLFDQRANARYYDCYNYYNRSRRPIDADHGRAGGEEPLRRVAGHGPA
ncbi:hypothetical protein DF3PB_6100001 [uncultured Defluviicoccus sp.]|uniref:Uncharacterized protein n=1 Tax=metagenome TaxID=256318 RepID=A0A380TKM5_9ZZZZ|nr:hypothetical protein DF3PB_6100001 [uncultured Defluviicoccus sp.]